MKVYRSINHSDLERPSVLTLGVFDGLHLGHQEIVRTVVERAILLDAVPTPDYFRPSSAARFSSPKRLPSASDILPEDGRPEATRHRVVVLEFNRELASVPAEDFIRRYMVEALQARGVFLERFRLWQSKGGETSICSEMSVNLGFNAAEVLKSSLEGAASARP
ncbi:MAG: hypothetical protein IPL01_05870 [Acidobacteria bacterium]|nr:hypothetical protein [Acidobacteriota bacterium]